MATNNRHLPGVAAALTTLGADDIHTLLQGIVHVLRRPHHVHHGDLRRMELLDEPLRRHPDRADEELRALLDDEVLSPGKPTSTSTSTSPSASTSTSTST